MEQRSNRIALLFLIVFGTAFGFVEAAVVYYLRNLLNLHSNYIIPSYKTLLNLGFITFISPSRAIIINHRIYVVEFVREAATIVMLVAIAFIAGKNRRQRLGAFLVSFACWDIMYYVFLKILDNWPSSLLTKDIFFLIPVVWIGPVLTPIIIWGVLFIVGVRLFLRPKKSTSSHLDAGTDTKQ